MLSSKDNIKIFLIKKEYNFLYWNISLSPFLPELSCCCIFLETTWVFYGSLLKRKIKGSSWYIACKESVLKPRLPYNTVKFQKVIFFFFKSKEWPWFSSIFLVRFSSKLEQAITIFGVTTVVDSLGTKPHCLLCKVSQSLLEPWSAAGAAVCF